ncbi:hypothetical protein MTR67_030577 [Solanum verrucosum]|uniref:Uncharacterized protein n=1 Tax=Solanum verrucosum TaxID=315347 RepID=A0AAF0TXU1_SOLVR|nr:uncharacterized protein LOC125823270 [Solanum verrucosum]WMV37192.1 hypothetical protein MTR67_030577 [Solanum verrucosum]
MDSSSKLFQISRELSVGHSSRIYYYRRGEGVPFEWEKQPGTPKINPTKEDVNIPLSPPPSFQSIGLTKPCFDDHDESKHFKVWLTNKMKKLHSSKRFVKSRDGDDSFNNSSSSSFDSNTKERDKFSRDLMEDSYCCNLTSMDKEEGYRKMHKREEIGERLFVERIVSRMSSVDQSYYRSTVEGIPFKWEMQPGTPMAIHTPQNEVIPPPSPPPMIQSLAFPKPCIPHHDQDNTPSNTWEKIKRMIKSSHQAGRRNSVISSSILKKKVLPLSKLTKDVLGRKFCFNPGKIKANLASSRRI